MYLEMQQSHGLKAFFICFKNWRNSLKMLLFQFTFKRSFLNATPELFFCSNRAPVYNIFNMAPKKETQMI
jgi:hypothetical protein